MKRELKRESERREIREMKMESVDPIDLEAGGEPPQSASQEWQKFLAGVYLSNKLSGKDS